MTERETLLKTLFDDPKRRHINIKFFRGSREAIQSEEFCAEVNTAIFQLAHGQLTALEEIEENEKTVDVRDLTFPA